MKQERNKKNCAKIKTQEMSLLSEKQIGRRGKQLLPMHRSVRLVVVFILSVIIALKTTTSNTQALQINNNKTATDDTSQQQQNATNNSATSMAQLVENNTTTTTITTARTPSEQEIEQAKKLIQEVATTIIDYPLRLAVNRPITSSSTAGMSSHQEATSNFAPNSIESMVSDASTQFGLNFLRKSNELGSEAGKNVVISPLSMQNLLSMVLLGSNGATELELAQVLGYQSSCLLHKLNTTAAAEATIDQNERMRPHEALHNVLESIMRATRFSPSRLVKQQQQDEDDSTAHGSNLLNTNLQDLQKQNSSADDDDKEAHKKSLVSAHLQTNEQNDTQPLSGQVNFTLANLLLTNRDLIKLDPNYELDLKHFYNVQMEQFSRSSKASSTPATSAPANGEKKLHERVNEWVKKMTQNQIEQLVQESDLNVDEQQQLAMILLNAAHFKGRWLHTFAPRATKLQTFYGKGVQESEVMFMRQKGEFGFAEFGLTSGQVGGPSAKVSTADDAETLLTEDNETTAAANESKPNGGAQSSASANLKPEQKLNCSALLLPFSLNDGRELSMVMLLPNKRDGLDELMANLDSATLNEIYKTLHEQQQQVQVEIPKFSFESTHDAKSTLEKMGLKRIFDETQADFGRMLSASSPTHNRVDKVVHKAKIMIDESGAEAAAASLVMIVSRNFVRPTPIFLANHPFLFIIRHSRSNMPLFMGQVNSLP